jgi:hypothetical protein
LLLFCSEKQGPAMRLEEGVGAAAALLRNHLTFWSSHPARAFFSTIQTNLSGTHQISVTEKSTSLIIDRNLAFSAGLTFCRLQEVNDTTSSRKNHAQKNAPFSP